MPLFVEELTKSVDRESVGAARPCAPSSSAIPATLHDSLDGPARSTRSSERDCAAGRDAGTRVQLRAPPGRLASRCTRCYSRPPTARRRRTAVPARLPPQATYLFKHALIQDTAYQSLLKSTRQQYHQQIAQVLEEQFPETEETQPELLAHHYTEAGLIEQAIPYWQKAGQRAIQRSAYVEAISHLTKGLELLKTLPDTPERAQQELTCKLPWALPLMATKGYAAPEVEKAYTRARELCQQVGETPQLFPVLWGLWVFYLMRGELQTARELGEQLLSLAQSVKTRSPRGGPLCAGEDLVLSGRVVPLPEHIWNKGLPSTILSSTAPCLLSMGMTPEWLAFLCGLGSVVSGLSGPSPKRSQEALTLAQECLIPLA